MSPVKNPSDFTVQALKEMLKTLGLTATGSKSELISRLMEADPAGDWLRGSDVVQNNLLHNEEQDLDTEASGAGEARIARREIEMLRRERELLERELAVARRQTELLRERERERERETERRMRIGGLMEQAETRRAASPTETTGSTARPSITAIAELLAHFDGVSDSWEVWEKQVRLLTTTYRLQDDMVKILIGARLRGKATEWFRSKPEHIEMSTDDLLLAMRAMFDYRPNKLARKREFEGRIWKRDEAFSAYMHDKITLANRVPIEEDDLIDYIVDGISDVNLQDQARIQGFKTTTSLLKAFEKITLRPKRQQDSVAVPMGRSDAAAAERGAWRHQGARRPARTRFPSSRPC